MRIRITDRGSGIAGEDQERLVQPFELGSHPRQPVDGRGLGLAIARAAAIAHGGRLQFDDTTPGRFAAVLVMPARAVPAPP